MKKKITFIMMLVVSFTMFGQETPAIVFETTKSSVSLSIRATNNDPAAQEQVWIDLNGNGELDSGEKVTTFGSAVNYNISTSTVRVFGPIWLFNCPNNEITSLDVSGAGSTLNQLVCNTNQITTLDLSMCEKLSSTSTCNGNLLTELKPSPVQGFLNMYSNRLNLSAMNNLVNELPDRTGKTAGSMTLWYGPASVNGENQNQLSQELYDILVSKNWVVKTAIPNAPYTGPFITTGIKELNAKEELVVKLRNDGIYVIPKKPISIHIYNLQGQLIHKEDLLDNQKFIPLKRSNIYFVNDYKIVL